MLMSTAYTFSRLFQALIALAASVIIGKETPDARQNILNLLPDLPLRLCGVAPISGGLPLRGDENPH
jgi:hypothetical protein